MALQHLQRIRSIYHRPQATARLTQRNFRTKRQTGNLEARRSGYLRGCGFSLSPHHRTTARTAHLSSSQVRYSCRANIGSRLGPLEPGHRRQLREGSPLAVNRARAAPNSVPEAAETLGSFTPRSEILYGRVKLRSARRAGQECWCGTGADKRTALAEMLGVAAREILVRDRLDLD